NVEVLRVLLSEQRFRRGSIVAAVVHVHVEVGGEELTEVWRKVVVLELDLQEMLTGNEITLDDDRRFSEAVLDVNDGLSDGNDHFAATWSRTVEVMDLAWKLRAVIQLVTVHPEA